VRTVNPPLSYRCCCIAFVAGHFAAHWWGNSVQPWLAPFPRPRGISPKSPKRICHGRKSRRLDPAILHSPLVPCTGSLVGRRYDRFIFFFSSFSAPNPTRWAFVEDFFGDTGHSLFAVGPNRHVLPDKRLTRYSFGGQGGSPVRKIDGGRDVRTDRRPTELSEWSEAHGYIPSSTLSCLCGGDDSAANLNEGRLCRKDGTTRPSCASAI